jgi:hypothetical protein
MNSVVFSIKEPFFALFKLCPPYFQTWPKQTRFQNSLLKQKRDFGCVELVDSQKNANQICKVMLKKIIIHLGTLAEAIVAKLSS